MPKVLKALRVVVKFILWVAIKKPFLFGRNILPAANKPPYPGCLWTPDASPLLPVIQPDPSADELVSFYKARRDEGYAWTFILGQRDPLSRPDLVRQLVGIVPMTAVITTGEYPLPDLPALYFVWMNSHDRGTHDAIRCKEGSFYQVIANLEDAHKNGVSPIVIHTVLNSQNCYQVVRMVHFWSRKRFVDGILFSCHTPVEGSGDEHLRLNDEQRLVIVDDLKRARKEFGNFVLMPSSAIEAMKPQNIHAQTEQSCATATFSRAFDAEGKLVPRCIFGLKAICNECGCVVTEDFKFLKKWSGWANFFEDLSVALRFGVFYWRIGMKASRAAKEALK